MKRLFATIGVFLFLAINISSVGSVYCEETEEEAAARRAKWDKGPRTIDVSNYPDEIKGHYKIFLEKCSQCHNIARPINSDFKPEDWERYIKRMMRKPGSGILPNEAKKIHAFLKYYAEEKEKAASEPQAPAEQTP